MVVFTLNKIKFLIILTFLLQSLNCLAMEVNVPGEIKKVTPCCYIVKTKDGRLIKILKPRDKKPMKVGDRKSFAMTMKAVGKSLDDTFNAIKGAINFD